MNTQLVASLFDCGSVAAIGVILTLVGYKAIAKKSGNPKYDNWYNSWGKHLKWLGPVLIGVEVIQLLFAFLRYA